jgi:ribokinase
MLDDHAAPRPPGAAPSRPRVVSVGSINQDLVIKVDHLPVMGETLHGAELVSSPGGKGGNQAVAASRLGISSAIIARVGHDSVGVDLCNRLEAEGVDTSWIVPTRDSSSGVALIVVRPDGESTITVAGGANMLLTPQDVVAAAQVILPAEVVLLQQEVPTAANLAAMRLARRAGALVSLNAGPLLDIDDELLELIASVDILVVNEFEASQLLRLHPLETSELARRTAVRELLRLGPGLAVITLGPDGAIAANRTDTLRMPSPVVDAVDGVGAGDAFCVGLAVATVEGRSLRHALQWAVTCGALATTGVGAQTSLPRRRDVELQRQLSELLPS